MEIKRWIYKIPLILFITILFFSTFISESNASLLSSDQTVEVEKNSVKFTLSNKSDQPFFNLTYTIYLPNGDTMDSAPVSLIKAQSSDVAKFSYDFKSLKKGRYLIYAKGSFYVEDDPYRQKRPTFFLAHTVFEKGEVEDCEIAVKEKVVGIGKTKGKFAVEIANNSEGSKKLSAEIILPGGMKSDQSVKQIDLEKDQVVDVDFTLQNQWRETGESTQIILVLSDENGDICTVQSFPITVRDQNNKVRDLLLAGLGFCFIYFVLKYGFEAPRIFTTIALFVFVFVIFFYFIPLNLIFSNTTTTGGDTFSQYGAAKFFNEEVFPNLKIQGWYPGSYAGFPIFTFYLPLPFILISILSLLIKFNIAFKIIVILGLIGLPFSVYFFTKKLKFSRLGILLSSIFSLLFVFNEAYSIYGGNALSTFAGEFSNAIGMVLLMLFSGSLYDGVIRQKRWKLNAFFLALLCLTHPFPFIMAVLQQAFFLLPRSNIKKNLSYLLKVDLVAFLLSAFWTVPSILRISHTTPLDEFWSVKFSKLVPPHLLVFFVISIITLVFCLLMKIRKIQYIGFSVFVAVFMLFISNNFGLVNVRFLPFITLYFLIIASYGIAQVLKIIDKKSEVLSGIAFCITVFSVVLMLGTTTPLASYWAKWNFTGVENKPFGDIFFEMMSYLRDLPGDDRIVYEHSVTTENFGTNRTFETFYEFTNKPTLEGLYIQSSATSPFVYFIQSETSIIPTRVIVGNDYSYFDEDFERMIDHLKLFNARYFIAVSDEVKARLHKSPEFKSLKEFYPYQIYELKSNPNSFIQVLQESPVSVETKSWAEDSYQWFVNNDGYVYVNSKATLDVDQKDCSGDVKIDRLSEERITFKTENIGCPHLIKISYFPKWKVKGAEKVLRASPNFMMVYPTEERVVLYYGTSFADYIALALSLMGIVLFVDWRELAKYISRVYGMKV